MTTLYIEEITDEDDFPVENAENFDANDAIHRHTTEEAVDKWKGTELAPCPRVVGGGATLICFGRKLFVFGGCDRTGRPSSQLSCYDLNSDEWTCGLSCKGQGPSGRFGHTSVAFASRMYVFGGQGFAASREDNGSIDTMVSFNDVHCLDTETLEWITIDAGTSDSVEGIKEESLKNRPLPRNSHTAVVLGDKMLVFGGANADIGPMGDVWSFDMGTHQWTEIGCRGDAMPGAREMHSACIVPRGHDRKGMLVMGGRRENGLVCKDLWVLDEEDGFIWRQMMSPQVPRCCHVSGFLKAHGVVCFFGGWDGMGTIFDDVATFDVQKEKWARVEAKVHVAERFGSACCVNNGELLVLGGVNMKEDLKDFVALRNF